MTPAYRRLELPSLYQFYSKPNFEAMSKGTDVYFFGLPVSGKTSLLMGLTGVEGKDCCIPFKTSPYAAALKQYVEAGLMSCDYLPNYATVVNATIEEKRKGGNGKEVYWNHGINFVELPCEQFACKIANNDDTIDMEDMGSGTVKLLRNDNPKVFFIIVDPTRDIFSFTFGQPVYDTNGVQIDIINESICVDQMCFLYRLISLFEMPKTKEFMKKVYAIHFIVTKADTIGKTYQERKERTRDLLLEKYHGPVQQLIALCRRAKRINYATDFVPMVYPFSLGRFSDHKTFEYDNRSSLAIIDALRHMTEGKKEGNFWDNLRDCLIKPL
jgi:hypothetical protein